MSTIKPVNDVPRRRRALWIALIAVAVVVVLAGVGLVAWAIGTAIGDAAKGTPDETPVASAASAPGEDERRAVYSFGRTSQTVPVPVPAPAVIEQRMPFQPTVEADRYRIVVRNVDFRGDVTVRNPVSVQSVYLGGHAGDGLFDADGTVRLSDGGELVGGAPLTTDWFDAETLPLGPDGEYLLGVSFSAAASTQVGVSPAVGWVRSGVADGSMSDDGNVGEFGRAGLFLDVSIEYAFDDPEHAVPVLAVLGHSLNAGANGNPEVEHEGEASAWHQIWARGHGGAASSLAGVGAWTANFLPDSPKWDLSSTIDADYVSIWSSSSDLVSGATLDDVGVAWVAVVEQARRSWPGAKIVAFTEPPRGAAGEGEALRLAWNDFLRTMPEQIDVLVDVDAIVADKKNPAALAAEYDGDGSHMSPAGNARVAEAFAEAIAQAAAMASATDSASE